MSHTFMRGSRWWWILFVVGAIVVLFIPLPARAQVPTERIFRIEASQFSYSPAVLQVNPGDRVTIELVATDVVHGLSIDGYDVQTTADPGQTAVLTFVANHAGSFRFHCIVTCGNLHPFMNGKLNVGPNNFFLRSIAFLTLAIVAGLWMSRR